MLSLLKRSLDRLLELALWLAMLSMTVSVLWQVFTRFVLQNPSPWTEELARFLLVWIGLLGSAVALRRKAHLGIDILVNMMPERRARMTAVFIHLCVIFFASGVLVYGGMDLVQVILRNRQISPALQIQMGYVYLALPISGFFITIYSLEFLVAEVRALIAPARIDTGAENVGARSD